MSEAGEALENYFAGEDADVRFFIFWLSLFQQKRMTNKNVTVNIKVTFNSGTEAEDKEWVEEVEVEALERIQE